MAEKVQLHTAYYLDPKFVGASGYEERLFIRLLAFCGANETGGVLPPNPWKHVGIPDARKAFAGLVSRGLIVPVDPFAVCPTCARAVPDVRPTCAARVPHVCPTCAAPVPAHTVQTQLVGWKKWQSNVDELARRRENERTRQANHRALSEGKSRDIPEMSRTLGKGREGKGEVSSKAAASSARERAAATEFTDGTPIPPEPDDDRPALSIVPTAIETGTSPRKPQPSQAARTLVRQVIPGLTREVTDQLANHVTQAARDGTPDSAIRTGLERWRDDPDRPRPGALPYRIGDAARDLAAQTSTTPARPSKQRGMAEMLAQARAEEAHQKAAGELE